MGETQDIDGGIIAKRWDFPIVELRPLRIGSAQTVEEMIAGLPHNNPDISSANFTACQGGPAGETAAGLLLVKPLPDREHEPTDDIRKRLDAAGLVSEGLPQLALLKHHADELWAAEIYYVGVLEANSIWWKPDGGYVVYLILNPVDRGFHLQWIGADTAGGTVAVRDEYRGDLNGQLWFLVRRKEPGDGGAAASA